MIDRILSRTGVGFALLFMVTELSYINSKSLQYMFSGEQTMDIAFGIIGAIAFSIVTVLVMRLSNRTWLKIVFPVFDIALVFCGFNLEHASGLLYNPVRFAMSIFLSLFAGLITYSLGQINAEQHDAGGESTKLKLLESQFDGLKGHFSESQAEVKSLQSKNEKIKSDIDVVLEREKLLKGQLDEFISNKERIGSNNVELEKKLGVTLDKLSKAETQLQVTYKLVEKYKSGYMAAEAARIRKKAEKNRTVEENHILTQMNN